MYTMYNSRRGTDHTITAQLETVGACWYLCPCLDTQCAGLFLNSVIVIVQNPKI